MAYGSRSKNNSWMGGSEAAPQHALLTLWNPKKSKQRLTSKKLTSFKALKTVNECKWTGNTKFDDIDRCLRSIGLQTSNSGSYTMTPIKLKGMIGYYLVNEDGSLHYDSRILKDETGYTIEYLSMSGFNDFEKAYSSLQ